MKSCDENQYHLLRTLITARFFFVCVIFQNGFVECEQESCPAVDDCYIYNKKTPGKCCDKCIGKWCRILPTDCF